MAIVSNLVVVLAYSLVFLLKPESNYLLNNESMLWGLGYMILSTVLVLGLGSGKVSTGLVVVLFVLPAVLIAGLTGYILVTDKEDEVPPPSLNLSL